MSTSKFPVLAESGYPKNDKTFNLEMEKMWNEVVPQERQAQVKEFARFLNGEVTSDLFLAEAAPEIDLGTAEAAASTAPRASARRKNKPHRI